MRTVLPEKWYVERTPENAQVLNEWADSVVDDPENWERPHTNGFVYWNGATYGVLMGGEEITYEEFTRLVLKK